MLLSGCGEREDIVADEPSLASRGRHGRTPRRKVNADHVLLCRHEHIIGPRAGVGAVACGHPSCPILLGHFDTFTHGSMAHHEAKASIAIDRCGRRAAPGNPYLGFAVDGPIYNPLDIGAVEVNDPMRIDSSQIGVNEYPGCQIGITDGYSDSLKGRRNESFQPLRIHFLWCILFHLLPPMPIRSEESISGTRRDPIMREWPRRVPRPIESCRGNLIFGKALLPPDVHLWPLAKLELVVCRWIRLSALRLVEAEDHLCGADEPQSYDEEDHNHGHVHHGHGVHGIDGANPAREDVVEQGHDQRLRAGP